MRTVSIICVFWGLGALALPWPEATAFHTFIDFLQGAGIAGNTYFAMRQQ